MLNILELTCRLSWWRHGHGHSPLADAWLPGPGPPPGSQWGAASEQAAAAQRRESLGTLEGDTVTSDP